MNVKAAGPDGLEAWCVALSACFINFVMAGLGRMSGILYVAFIDIFQVDRLQASVPFSARSLTRNLLGPVVGILGQKYGVRTTTLLGGFIGTLSALACFYANSILWITVAWGAINGAGTALTITLPQVVLCQHFKKYRTTASGMAFSGGCVGSFLFPVILEYLLYTYGLGGTFLIMAGVIMNAIPAAMLLRKPSWMKQKSREEIEVSTVDKALNDVSQDSVKIIRDRVVHQVPNNGSQESLRSNRGRDALRVLNNGSQESLRRNQNRGALKVLNNGSQESLSRNRDRGAIKVLNNCSRGSIRSNRDRDVHKFLNNGSLQSLRSNQDKDLCKVLNDGSQQSLRSNLSRDIHKVLNSGSQESLRCNRNRETKNDCGQSGDKFNKISSCSNDQERWIPLSKNLNIDTGFLRENQRIIIKLFAEYFGDRNKTESIEIYSVTEQLEFLYTVIDETLVDRSMQWPEMVTGTQYSINPISNPENRENRFHSEIISDSVVTHLNPKLKDCKIITMPHLMKLITCDSNKIFLFFHEKDNSIPPCTIFKVLEQLNKLYRLLEVISQSECQNAGEQHNEIQVNNQRHEKLTANSNTFVAHVRTAIRLHKNPLFLLISFCRSVHFLTFVPAITIVVDFAIDKGLLETDGKYVIAAMSLGDLVGRLCLGWITDKEYLDLPKYMLIVMILQGACTACLSLMHSRPMLLSLLAIFGLLQGSLFVRHPVLVSKYLGKNEQSVAMGCFNFFSGLLGFALPNYIGYFRDTIGSYDGIFYINGSIGAFVGLMWLFEPYFVKYSSSGERSAEPV